VNKSDERATKTYSNPRKKGRERSPKKKTLQNGKKGCDPIAGAPVDEIFVDFKTRGGGKNIKNGKEKKRLVPEENSLKSPKYWILREPHAVSQS